MQTRGEVRFFERGISLLIKKQKFKIKMKKSFYLDDYFEKGLEYYRSKMPIVSDDQVVLAKEVKHKDLKHLHIIDITNFGIF